jgi:HPr kinase/phosphorylase
MNDEYMDILGTKVTCHAIPVRPGRNLAIICESAAVNRRLKKMGYNAAQALNDVIMQQNGIK